MKKQKFDVSVYYFPNFHLGDPRNEKWHGKNWCEWEVLKNAIPRFENHYIPKPLWGYEDESDPVVMSKKIETASKYGITNFIFDWYYYNDGPFLNKCLEEGFLKAKNKKNLKFSLMWANHDWTDIHPATLESLKHPNVQAKGRVTIKKFEEIMDYVIDHYFTNKNYYRLDGDLYFSIYDINLFIESMGGLENAKKEILIFRDKIAKKGLGKLHLNAITWACSILKGESTISVDSESLKFMGFDSTTSYVWIHEHVPANFPTNEYKDYCKVTANDYELLSNRFSGLPYYPNVSCGWDSSPRCFSGDKFVNAGYPFMGMLINNTPELFEEALRNVKEKLLKTNLKTKMLTINAWNEWTEGSYLEPDDRFGYGKLEAIKKVFK